MKHTNVLLVVIFFLSLISCNEDLQPSEQILGEWNLDSIEYFNCTNNDDNEVNSEGCITEEGNLKCLEGSLTFIAPSTLTLKMTQSENGQIIDNTEHDVSYELIDENESKLSLCKNSNCEIYTLSITESQMVLTKDEPYESGCKDKITASK